MTFPPTSPRCSSPQENNSFPEGIDLESNKPPLDSQKIEKPSDQKLQEIFQETREMYQGALWTREVLVNSRDEMLKNNLEEKNKYLKEKVKKLETKLNKIKEESDKQVLTFAKILRFIYEKFAAFFSQKRNAIVHFWYPHSVQGGSLRHK